MFTCNYNLRFQGISSALKLTEYSLVVLNVTLPVRSIDLKEKNENCTVWQNGQLTGMSVGKIYYIFRVNMLWKKRKCLH